MADAAGLADAAGVSVVAFALVVVFFGSAASMVDGVGGFGGAVAEVSPAAAGAVRCFAMISFKASVCNVSAQIPLRTWSVK